MHCQARDYGCRGFIARHSSIGHSSSSSMEKRKWRNWLSMESILATTCPLLNSIIAHFKDGREGVRVSEKKCVKMPFVEKRWLEHQTQRRRLQFKNSLTFTVCVLEFTFVQAHEFSSTVHTEEFFKFWRQLWTAAATVGFATCLVLRTVGSTTRRPRRALDSPGQCVLEWLCWVERKQL